MVSSILGDQPRTNIHLCVALYFETTLCHTLVRSWLHIFFNQDVRPFYERCLVSSSVLCLFLDYCYSLGNYYPLSLLLGNCYPLSLLLGNCYHLSLFLGNCYSLSPFGQLLSFESPFGQLLFFDSPFGQVIFFLCPHLGYILVTHFFWVFSPLLSIFSGLNFVEDR